MTAALSIITIGTTGTMASMGIAMTEIALYPLMTWLSPAYPIGSFSYSHGIEYAVEAGRIVGVSDLRDWIATALTFGAGRSDAALFAAAWRAVAAENETELDAIADLAAAWRGTRETALESAAQGAAFLAATRAAWPHPALEAIAARRGGAAAFPVAVAAACAAHGVPIGEAVTAYLHAFANTLVSAGIRLVPLGQTDGQKILAAVAPVVAEAAASALAASLDDVGTAAPLLDWCSMRHETQYTRLFRS